MASAVLLSINDRFVLGALLDPEATLGTSDSISQDFAIEKSHHDVGVTSTVREAERQILLRLNAVSPSRLEIETSLAEFDTLLKVHRNYASGFNNRAQARRLLYNDMKALVEHPEDARAIIADLGLAISLATPTGAIEAVSPENARILASAHTHRAYLLYKASQMGSQNSDFTWSIPEFAHFDSETLQEMASRDFALGGKYGNNTAKQLAVHTNPYAKLCGSIVKEALHREVDKAKKTQYLVE